jgi:hypothetical protein
MSRRRLIALLACALVTPARVDSTTFATDGKLIVAGIVLATAAVAVTATVLILHHKPQSKITGCVKSEGGALNITDEKDKRTYTLAGDTIDVKPRDRMTLQGKTKDMGKGLTFETRKVAADLGACPI